MKKETILTSWILAGSLCTFNACALPSETAAPGDYLGALIRENRNVDQFRALQVKLKNSPWQNQMIACAVVPPLSPYRHLPDQLPADGKYDNNLHIIMAPNEIGHASFLILPFGKESKVKIPATAMLGGRQTIPASAIDLRIVKYWYQDGTAWSSYFADPLQQELVPELLLHDENLIKVDHEKKCNYLRVGNSYQWISYPESIHYGHFNYVTAPVKDAEKLADFTLTPNENKKFFLTVRLPKGIAAGNYTGTLTIHSSKQVLGRLNLSLRILPFELPEPQTWYDLNKKFYASMYMPPLGEHLRMAGGDMNLVKNQRKAMYRNMLDHNLNYPLVDSPDRNKLPEETAEKLFAENLKWMKECGFPSDAMFGGVPCTDWYLVFRKPEQRPAGYDEKFYRNMDQDLATIRSIMGKDILVYPVGWDEPSMKLLKDQRPSWEKIHERGMKIISTAKDRHLQYGAYNEDFANYAGLLSPKSARIWHAMDNRIANYANPHTGPENPDYSRRAHGMELYKADYDGTCNYHFLENGGGNVWRDTNGGFRTFAFVYPTLDGVLDTLQYEGFRAGLDDIRYATKLKQLAGKAMTLNSVPAYYAAKKALRFLALAPAERMELDTLRLEMIDHILKLRQVIADTVSKTKER